MKILFVATKPKPDNMEFHIIQAFAEMGHEVVHFDIKTVFGLSPSMDRYAQYFARTFLREPERIREKVLLEYARKTSPDLVLVLLGNLISPKTVELLKKAISVPIVCWCQDTLATMGRQYLIGSPFDVVFSKDHYMVNLFNDMIGKRFAYLPEACNPAVHYYEIPPQSEASQYECDVTTAASLYYYRQEILGHINNSFRLKIWGDKPDWLNYKLGNAHTGRYVVDSEKRFAFSMAKIALNTLFFAEIEGVNCRLFEISGCGGFQLVSHKKEVGEFFDIGSEVETFHNRNDLIEKIHFYLREPEKRQKIAQSGMEKAHRFHTYTHRLNDLLHITSQI